MIRLRSAPSPRHAFGLAVPLAILGVWELAKAVGALPYETLPSPSSIFGAVWALTQSGQLSRNVLHTLIAALGGWTLGSLVGLGVGIALGVSARLSAYSMTSINVLRALPAVTLVPATVLALSQSLAMEFFITGWVSVWPVLISAIDGVRGVSQEHQDVARMLRLARVARVRKISLPAATPRVMVGLRLGLSSALVLAIVAELVGNPEGVGYALLREQETRHPANEFGYIFVIGALGLLLNYLFIGAVRTLVPGGRVLATGAAQDA